MNSEETIKIYNKMAEDLCFWTQTAKRIAKVASTTTVGFGYHDMTISGPLEYRLYVQFCADVREKYYTWNIIMNMRTDARLHLRSDGEAYIATWKACYHRLIKQLDDIVDCEHTYENLVKVLNYVDKTFKSIIKVTDEEKALENKIRREENRGLCRW